MAWALHSLKHAGFNSAPTGSGQNKKNKTFPVGA
jgi:hypothetical protein